MPYWVHTSAGRWSAADGSQVRNDVRPGVYEQRQASDFYHRDRTRNTEKQSRSRRSDGPERSYHGTMSAAIASPAGVLMIQRLGCETSRPAVVRQFECRLQPESTYTGHSCRTRSNGPIAEMVGSGKRLARTGFMNRGSGQPGRTKKEGRRNAAPQMARYC